MEIFSKIIIRPARTNDAESIFIVHKRSIQELYNEDYTIEQIKGWFPSTRTPKDYSNKIFEGETIYHVAEIKGTIIGFSEFKQGELIACYIHPAHVNRGIGKALFKNVEKIIVQLGYNKMTLDSSVTALGFYQKMGMIMVEKIIHHFGSVELDAIRMEKVLG